jgi:hypothetical protein
LVKPWKLRKICDLLRLILRNCGLHSDSKSNDPY